VKFDSLVVGLSLQSSQRPAYALAAKAAYNLRMAFTDLIRWHKPPNVLVFSIKRSIFT